MNQVLTIHGDGWNAFFRKTYDQWVLKYKKAPGVWGQHRIPPIYRNEVQVRHYSRAWLREHEIALRTPCSNGSRRDGVLHAGMTFRDFGEMWTSGTLAQLFPRHVKPKKSAGDDECRLGKHVYPLVGNIAIREFVAPHGLELAERIMNALPPVDQLSDGTARHVAVVVHRLLGLAVYPAKLLPVHPIPKGFLPSAGNTKAKVYLYPDEDAQLLACTRVPLVLRLLFGFLIREGCRVSEVARLQLAELDLDHGWIYVDRTKSGQPHEWPLQAGTTAALVRWRDRFLPTQAPAQHVFPRIGDFPRTLGPLLNVNGLPRELHKGLRMAGISRPQLFSQDQSRIRLRVHDLRASFVTVALANGRSESWVADRTGHRSSQMINRYKRLARGHQELALGDFVPLVEAIPELA